MSGLHVAHGVGAVGPVLCGSPHKTQSIARAHELSCQLQGCASADEKRRTYALMRAALFSALAPKRDGTHPIFNGPVVLEVI